MLNIRPSIELFCLVVFDLSCNVLFRFFFFVLFVFLLLLPLMANKVVCMCDMAIFRLGPWSVECRGHENIAIFINILFYLGNDTRRNANRK